MAGKKGGEKILLDTPWNVADRYIFTLGDTLTRIVFDLAQLRFFSMFKREKIFLYQETRERVIALLILLKASGRIDRDRINDLITRTRLLSETYGSGTYIKLSGIVEEISEIYADKNIMEFKPKEINKKDVMSKDMT